MAPLIRGIEEIVSWPQADTVSHSQPDSVTVYNAPDGVLEVIEAGETVYTAEATTEGRITVPSAELADALARRLRLELLIGGDMYGGYIKLLPAQEEVPFGIAAFIKDDGTINSSTAYLCTDYEDVRGATDIAVRGKTEPTSGGVIRCLLYAYDEDRQPVRPLIAGSSTAATIRHVTPDGTYAFVRASAKEENLKSLVVYF